MSAATAPRPSARAVTADLMDRLRRHYIKPGVGLSGGVFVPECGLNGTTSRRCDAVYVGFTSTSGRLLVGHEVKATRSDWLHELDQVQKADVWADQCHAWWLVTAPDVVRDGELPAGWGHMVPGPSATRMKVLHPATHYLDRHPSWLVVRSVIARLDTLQTQAMERFRHEEATRLRAEHQRALAEVREQRVTADPATRVRLDALDRVERLLGFSLTEWGDSRVQPEEFAKALKVVRAHRDLAQRYDGLGAAARDLRQQADRLDLLAKAMEDFCA
jgi:hypothetical protein